MHSLTNALRIFRRVLHDLTANEPVELSPEELEELQWFSDQVHEMTPGCLDVAIERSRQITEKGYDQKHDDAHDKGELAKAGVAYAHLGNGNVIFGIHHWPFSSKVPRTPVGLDEQITAHTKGAALIVAEIDRLRRLQGASEQPIV